MITQLPDESRLMYLVRVASAYIGDYAYGEIEYDDRGLIKGEFRSSRRVLKYEAID